MIEDEKWQFLAMELLHQVYSQVNTREMIGTDEETGVGLMFFNVKKHDGKSTFLCTEADVPAIKKLLKTAYRGMGGPKTKIVPPAGRA